MTELKTRLAGCFCPFGTAHYRYWMQSVRQGKDFRPSDELHAQMDAEQAAYDAGKPDWQVYG